MTPASRGLTAESTGAGDEKFRNQGLAGVAAGAGVCVPIVKASRLIPSVVFTAFLKAVLSIAAV